MVGRAMTSGFHKAGILRISDFVCVEIVCIQPDLVFRAIVEQHVRTHIRLIIRSEFGASHGEFSSRNQRHAVLGSKQPNSHQNEKRVAHGQTYSSTISSSITNSVAPNTSI